MKLPFTTGFYSLPSTSVSNQRCVNLFIHTSEDTSRSTEQLEGFSGITEVLDTGYGKTRGSIVFNNDLYRVDGKKLVRIDYKNVVTDVSGSVQITGFGRVSIAENGESICIVDPYGSSYFYDKDNGLVQIVDADFLDIEANFGTARTVVYSNGFFVYNTDKVLFQSSLSTTNKGQSFNALEFDDADTFPDDLVTIIASQGNVYAFGVDSYELYRVNPNTTTGEFAFSRQSTQSNEIGILGRFNLVSADNSIFFIGGSNIQNPSVYQLSGSQAQKISTDAIDMLIEDAPNGFAMAWGERGQLFRSFTFQNTTIVYNSRNKKWQEIQEQNFTEGWRVQTINRAYGKLLVSDNTGKLGILDKDVYTWFGDTVLDYITTQPFSSEGRVFTVETLEAFCQSGVGNALVENPTISMSYSRDGVVFGNERYRHLGAAGDRAKRQVWRMIGRIDDSVVFRFSFSAPCKKTLISLEAELI